ncbi:hypothetical protein A5779_17740 [Mycolicibacterium peregrinum]|uniref:Uncharacterized protein n=1 Tax=Mycolicibacterium peregrinum TaxID=43304 RepID=A0A1A0WDE0_MYCPR|nr:hypothetical protein A5779_17740 [Mycolicibacterium peregrinum]
MPGLTNPFSDHSQYYTQGGESLYALGDIVSGHGEDLQRHGMTAPHRTSLPFLPDIPVLSDPETWRPGTSGHRH